MPIKQPQRDLPVGLRGGSDTWDQSQASVVLDADWFESAPSLPAITGTLSATETGADSFVATGSVSAAGIVGTLAATESGADAFVATGTATVGIIGSMAAVEAGEDGFAASGLVRDREITTYLPRAPRQHAAAVAYLPPAHTIYRLPNV